MATNSNMTINSWKDCLESVINTTISSKNKQYIVRDRVTNKVTTSSLSFLDKMKYKEMEVEEIVNYSLSFIQNDLEKKADFDPKLIDSIVQCTKVIMEEKRKKTVNSSENKFLKDWRSIEDKIRTYKETQLIKELSGRLQYCQEGRINSILSKLLSKYNINPKDDYGQQLLVKIAKWMIPKKKLCWDNTLFPIKQPLNLMDIAKLSITYNSDETIRNIHTFGFNNQTELIELAKFCVQNSVKTIAENIESFGIKNQEALIEIAKLCAQKNGSATARLIGNFGINKEEALIEIIQLCVANQPEAIHWIGHCIDNFKNINKRDALIPIFRLCVQKYPERVPEYIKKFRITDQANLTEAVKLHAEKVGIRALEESLPLCPFQFSQEELQKLHITIAYFHKDLLPSSYSKLCAPLTYFPFPKILEARIEAQKVEISTLLEELITFSHTMKLDVLSLTITSLKGKMKKLTKEEERNLRENVLPWIAFTASKLSLFSVDPAYQIAISKLLEQTVEMRDPTARYCLSHHLIHLMNSSPQKIKNVMDVYNSEQFLEKKYGLLPGFFIAILEGQKPHNQNSSLVTSFGNLGKLKSNKSKTPFLKEARTAKLVFWTLNELIQHPFLSFEEKEALLKKITQEKKPVDQVRRAFIQIKGLLALNQIDHLKELALGEKGKSFYENLNEVYQSSFLDIFPRDIDEDKIQDFLGKFRDEFMVLTYAANLKKLENNEDQALMKKAISQCLEEALKGKFPQSRYESSYHLNEVFKLCPSLKDQWTNNQYYSYDPNKKIVLSKKITIQEAQQGDFFLVDTDDIVDLFACSTEIEGSCQNVHGEPTKNKCLLGYVMDGKNRLIAIKNKTGKIEARAIFRLLIDKKTSQPILFLERMYPANIKKEFAEAIQAAAKMRAEDLKLPLYTQGGQEEKPQDIHAFISLGNRAPYEYVDASNIGVIKEGKFTISKAYQVV